MAQQKLVVIAGPTASGKTQLAIQLAKEWGAGILSFDSRQCYQEMSIGTAKPTLQEQQGIPHFFIDSHSIHQPVSAADYERYALQVLQQAFTHRHTMIAVGGTGLYLKALLHGLDDMPPVSAAVEEEIKLLLQQRGIEALQQAISQEDPHFYTQGEIQNPHRLIRALAFVRSTGKSILHYRTGKKKERGFATQLFGIEVSRHQLYQQINQRVDAMIAQGLVQEAKQLQPYQALKPLQTVGYQELFDYFEGKCTLPEAIDTIKQHTRHYAKRQLTWFRKMNDLQWVGNYEDLRSKMRQL